MGEFQNLYGNAWRKARSAYLRAHPLCVICDADGRGPRAATVVDHREPHKGDLGRFWDQENWQALCATHHNSSKQGDERTGRVRGCDASGRPIDPAHPWNKP